MEQNELVWRIAGGSGDGIDSTSQNFATALMRSGYDVFTHRHYPSRIRGGHTYVEVRAAPDTVRSRGDGYNFLLALGDSFARNPQEEAYYGNEEIKPLAENLDDLREGGVIVYDEGLIDIDDVPDFDERVEENDWHVHALDLRGLARDAGREIMRNTAGVGVTAALAGIDTEPIKDLMRESMDGDMLDANLEVFDAALDLVDDADIENDISLPEASHEEEQTFISGSEGVAYGALDAGCRFISGYPMTPWTEVFTILSKHLPAVGGVSEQVEDEIAAAALAVGASHAGVKAMSGSSGGGFALMSEPLGLAEMTETPFVLIEAMRAGPSTGMPTKTEQGDLEHILYTSQGDSSRVVFAPSDSAEAYEQTREAFRLAYEYQLPAIVIIDQKLSGENINIPRSFFDREPDPSLGSTLSEEELAEAAHGASGKFKRFGYDPEEGVSPRSLPGQKGGRFLATGNEHNEVGHISEDPTNRVLQMDKRVEKLDRIATDLDGGETHQTLHGDESADYGILSFGSTGGAVADAVDRLAADGRSVKAMNVSQLMPFAAEEVGAFLRSVDAALVVEMNATAQFRGLVQRELGQHGSKLHSLLKYNGNPFEPAEVVRGFEAEIEGGTATPAATTRVEPAAGD